MKFFQEKNGKGKSQIHMNMWALIDKSTGNVESLHETREIARGLRMIGAGKSKVSKYTLKKVKVIINDIIPIETKV